MAFIAVALFSTVISITAYSTYYRHCGTWPWESQLQREILPADRFQCVGLSLGDYEFFDNLGDTKGVDQKLTDELKDVEAKIYKKADVAAFYAANALRARKVIIYYSDDNDDLYDKDLRDQIRPAFEARGLAVNEQQYQINPGDDDTNHVGRDACSVGPEGVVFYAGRAE